MTRTLAISDTGLRLIKAFEGFRPDDRSLVTGTRVVGYGHRLDTDDDPVHMSRAEAEEQLLYDLEPIEEIVNDEVHAPLSQGQFDALCSLAFNIGPDAFRASDIVRALNNGRVLDAANGFDVWRKATVNGKTYVVDALMRRRTAEKSLFLRNEPAVPAPSAMLQPQPDNTAPFGPTDDGLPKVTIGEASGVIDAANIINADRVDPVETAVSLLTVSDLIDEDADDHFDSALAVEDDFGDRDDDLDDDGLEDDDLDGEDAFEDEDDLIDDASEDDLDDEDDEFYGYDDDLLDGDESLDEPIATDIDDADTDDADDDKTDDPDISALIPPADRHTIAPDTSDDAQVDTDTPSEETAQPSVISSAANSLGDRLSALLDSDEPDTNEPPLDTASTSTLLPTPKDGENKADLVVTEADDSARSNLLSFPKRELVLDDDSVSVSETDESVTVDTHPVETGGMLVIDDLAADDVIRASRDPENPVFDPEGDPVENAMRYLERQASEKKAKKSNAGMWIPIALGATLVGASAVFIGRGATQMLSTWGPTAVTAAAITGGVTVLFAIYAAARGRSA